MIICLPDMIAKYLLATVLSVGLRSCLRVLRGWFVSFQSVGLGYTLAPSHTAHACTVVKGGRPPPPPARGIWECTRDANGVLSVPPSLGIVSGWAGLYPVVGQYMGL